MATSSMGVEPGPDGRARCWWCLDAPEYVEYHDRVWGRPIHDHRQLFELLVLESFQSGLSWLTILRKREGYRRAFARFDPERVAQLDPEPLMQDASIVRNRLKIESTIANARAVLDLDGGFVDLVWSFVGGEQKRNEWPTLAEVPAETDESRAMSKELKRRGFRFVGPTVCYAFMQAAGLVDDHVTSCFRRAG